MSEGNSASKTTKNVGIKVKPKEWRNAPHHVAHYSFTTPDGVLKWSSNPKQNVAKQAKRNPRRRTQKLKKQTLAAAAAGVKPSFKSVVSATVSQPQKVDDPPVDLKMNLSDRIDQQNNKN